MSEKKIVIPGRKPKVSNFARIVNSEGKVIALKRIKKVKS